MQRQLPSVDRANAIPAARTAAAFDSTPASVSRRGMMRFLSGIAVAAMTGLVLTGCGGEGDDGDDEDDD
jgi:hypothetical protein